ncbi:unnamed protein product [Bursaphelenchus xylophilus]|uniref:(pine wood nematode) hypothetical protein n=1 Tax=Bursaphelenchus xylophilus TaxID=6326 RepID=A0A1I7SCX0_BURXY|nr:unnamed protein product [Bursaphelenchus xylophilus]CAG9093328.1 unnamed protein product [Bursaphelenchus xylophilus]
MRFWQEFLIIGFVIAPVVTIRCNDGNVYHGKQVLTKMKCPRKVEWCLKYGDQKGADWFLMCDYENFCGHPEKQKKPFQYICCNIDYCNSSVRQMPPTYSLIFASLFLPILAMGLWS